MLKFVVDDIATVPEASRPLYEQGQDGKHYLQVDGVVPKDKLEEFRNNNIELKKQLDKFKDVDPAKYQQLLEEDKKHKEKKLLDAGEVDKVVEERVKTMRSEYEGKITEKETELSGLHTRLSELLIDSQVKTLAITASVLPQAVDDVVLRAKQIFRVVEGKVIAVNGDGKTIYDVDGTSPLSIESWLKKLKVDASHLFGVPAGGGAPGAKNVKGGEAKSSLDKISQGLASRVTMR